jgi:serine-type D-Ala-D-Ala carboxypeptidase/endopeptidase
MRPGSARLRSCAFALGLVAALAHAEAPVCSNPPPAVATDGIMRHAGVAAAVRDLAAEIERDRQRAGLASVAIAVVHGETVLLAAGYGCANVALGTPATPDTVYRTGSVTKLLEATALMQLRDAGRLQLDDPVAKSVPEVRFLGLNGERALPTWRQLAAHTSGLPRDIPPVLGTVPGLFHYLERERAVSAPGARYAYSNLGFVVLGASIAEVAGERYHAYVRRHILEPLGMTASTFDPRSVPGDRLAAGYLRLDRTGDGWSGYAAGDRNPFPPLGTLLSSVNDLSRFIAFQFRRPVAGEAQVLSPASIREMWRPVAAIGPFGSAAIGWLVLPYGPYTMVRKDGGLPGFTANVSLVPEARLGAVALVNESPQRLRASGAEIAKLERLVFERLLPPIARVAAPVPSAQATGAVARIDSRAENPSYQRASAGREGRQSSSP